MGTNTPNLQLFKPDPDDNNVNVETDLNANYDILDDKVQEALDGSISTTENTRIANSATFTAETQVDSIVVPVVNGQKYKIIWDGAFFSSVANDLVRGRIREDSVSGTVRQTRNLPLPTSSTSIPLHLEAFWTASSTGNKTFVATGQRVTGTGNITAEGGAVLPTSFYVEKVNG